jgi:serine/threonine protein kinase
VSGAVDLRAAVTLAGATEEIPKPGTLIGEKYRVEGVIGSGGMGIILAATHDALERRVAIKLLPVQAAQDPEHLARFRREAKALASVRSEHVVHVLDFGTFTTGAPFIVMERLDGTLLSDVVKERGKLPVDEAIDYVIQACEGVAEAHGLGIVHRDLKPANLFITSTKAGPVVKVFDFGASKLTAESSLQAKEGAVTMATSLIGSPRYMAPEQLKSALEVDKRVDVYALGVTLHELLSGEPLFSAETLAQIFTKVLWDPPPPLSNFRDDLPEGLDAVVQMALEKIKEKRYQTLEEFVLALAPFAAERSAHVLETLSSRLLEPRSEPSLVSQVTVGGVPVRAKAGSGPVIHERMKSLTNTAPLWPSQGAAIGSSSTPSLTTEKLGLATPATDDSLSQLVPQLRMSEGQRRTRFFLAAAAVLLVPLFVIIITLTGRQKNSTSTASAPSNTAPVVLGAGAPPTPTTPPVIPPPDPIPPPPPEPNAGPVATAPQVTRPDASGRAVVPVPPATGGARPKAGPSPSASGSSGPARNSLVPSTKPVARPNTAPDSLDFSQFGNRK